MKKILLLSLLSGIIAFSDTNAELMKKMESFSKNAFYEFNEVSANNRALGKGTQDVVENSDKILNEVYNDLVKTLNKTDKENLLDAQRMWVKVNGKIDEYNEGIFNDYLTGREGILAHGPLTILDFTCSRIYFLNTYLNRNNKDTNSEIKTAFKRFEESEDTSLFLKEKDIKNISISELDKRLNTTYGNVIKQLEKNSKSEFYEAKEKKLFTETVQKIKSSQIDWIKYRDLNFKFIDENKDFDSVSKEMMKKYIYVEMINYYEVFYYYWKEEI